MRTQIAIDLDSLEMLLSRIRLNRVAPLAHWRRRLESISRQCDGLSRADQQHLNAVVEYIAALERTVSTQDDPS
jgi:hypothetical protein